MSVIGELFAPDITVWQSPELPWGGEYHGLNGALTFFSKLRENIESEVTTESLFAAGDHVVQTGILRPLRPGLKGRDTPYRLALVRAIVECMSFTPRGATCVVEQLWPVIDVDLASAQLQRVIRAASLLPRDARPRVLGATLIPEDETLFTWCIAPSIDAVRSLLVGSGVRFDRVLEVVHTDETLGSSKRAARPITRAGRVSG